MARMLVPKQQCSMMYTVKGLLCLNRCLPDSWHGGDCVLSSSGPLEFHQSSTDMLLAESNKYRMHDMSNSYATRVSRR